MNKPIIHIVGGGTVIHVRPHFSVCAPAYGTLAKSIARECSYGYDHEVRLHLTRMASADSMLETNDDLAELAKCILDEPRSKIVFWTPAVTDWQPEWGFQDGFNEHGVLCSQEVKLGVLAEGSQAEWGKDAPRLQTRLPGNQGANRLQLNFKPAQKLLSMFRTQQKPYLSNNRKNPLYREAPRKDIFLVACKTTAGATEDEMYEAGVRMMKANSCNLVLVNDVHTRLNMIVTPEQARYCVTKSRNQVVEELVEMALSRSKGTFTRTTLHGGERQLIPLVEPTVPETFRRVIKWCIDNGAYKQNAAGKTVGHFAYRAAPDQLWSSLRHRNFNKLSDQVLVPVEFGMDPTKKFVVRAFGAKPSAGARSQMQLFQDHPEFDCVVHFHCPLQNGVNDIPVRSQREFECGSLQCGKNTSDGIKVLKVMGRIHVGVVMLDKHGPNILFKSTDDPKRVIEFINETFALTKHTGQS